MIPRTCAHKCVYIYIYIHVYMRVYFHKTLVVYVLCAFGATIVVLSDGFGRRGARLNL